MNKQRKSKFIALFSMFAMVLVGAGITAARTNISKEVSAVNWEAIASSEIVSGNKYLITTVKDSVHYYLPTGSYTSKGVSVGVVSSFANISEDEGWFFTGNNTDGYTIADDDGNKLYTIADNNGLRSGSTTGVWKFPAAVNLQFSGTSRYLAMYLTQDWRTYNNTTTQNSTADIYLYKIIVGGPVLTDLIVTSEPTKKVYENGEAFDKTGMVITGVYDSKPNEVIDNASIVVTPSVMTMGVTSVNISYGGIEKTISGFTVNAATSGIVTYDLTAKNTFTTSGTIPSGSSAAIVETYSTSKQMTSNNSQTVTFTNYGNIKITKITLSARSNSGGGAGYFKAIVDGVDTVIIADSAFNSAGWYGGWSTSYVDVVKTVDIMASSTLKFEIKASANSLYVQTYTLEWEEVEEEPLEAISINKLTATIVEGEEETFSAVPTPASADNSVTWSSSKTSVATVDSGGKVSAHVPGTAVVTATSTVDTSISGSVTVTVISAEYLPKVTSVDDLYIGAKYILANESGTHAMANVTTANYIIGAAAKFPEIDDVQMLKYSESFMKIELGEASGGKYSLKTVSSNPELDSKYIYAAGTKATGENWLRLEDSLTDTGSWTISFAGGALSMVADVEAGLPGTLQFNTGTSGFAAYVSASQTAIALYLDESSVPVDASHHDASSFSTWIMSQTGGNIVTPECASKYETAKTKWAALSLGAQAVFKEHEDFLNARNRLERWAIANGETLEQFYSGVSGGQQREFLDNKASLGAVVVLSVLGITTIVGFYFLKRKEKVHIE